MTLAHVTTLLGPGWQAGAVPILPTLASARVYLLLSWSLVVLALFGPLLESLLRPLLDRGMRSGTRWPWRLLDVLIVALVIAPPPWGLASWLGLAFQAPAVLTTLLCAWRVGHRVWPRHVPPLPVAELLRWRGAGLLLGLWLLCDVFALFPLSIYALGFNPLLMPALAALACLPWLWAGRALMTVLLLVALAAHALWRWPTGNLWDVWVDPGLALWLAWGWAGSVLSRSSHSRRKSQS